MSIFPGKTRSLPFSTISYLSCLFRLRQNLIILLILACLAMLAPLVHAEDSEVKVKWPDKSVGPVELETEVPGFLIEGWVCGSDLTSRALEEIAKLKEDLARLENMKRSIKERVDRKIAETGNPGTGAPLSRSERSDMEGMKRLANDILHLAKQGPEAFFGVSLDARQVGFQEVSLESVWPDGTAATFTLSHCYSKDDLSAMMNAEVESARQGLQALKNFDEYIRGLIEAGPHN